MKGELYIDTAYHVEMAEKLLSLYDSPVECVYIGTTVFNKSLKVKSGK